MAPPQDADVLFRAHAPALRTYLARFIGDDDVAADVLQETFSRYLVRAPVVHEARAWLYAVATNLAVQTARTRRRRERLLDHAAPGDLPLGAPESPDRVVERHERERRVRRALAALSERDRTVLLMRSAGFTHAEMASAVGTTTKSVGTIVARALAKLERALTLGEGARPGPA
jgi:RNA polymerase sigma factor (sigma-70 family)